MELLYKMMLCIFFIKYCIEIIERICTVDNSAQQNDLSVEYNSFLVRCKSCCELSMSFVYFAISFLFLLKCTRNSKHRVTTARNAPVPRTYTAPWKSVKSTTLALVTGLSPVQFNAWGVHCFVQWVNKPVSRSLLILIEHKHNSNISNDVNKYIK